MENLDYFVPDEVTVCYFASIAVDTLVRPDKTFDFKKLKLVARIATKNLSCVFTPEIIKDMAFPNLGPVIFVLSDPTIKALLSRPMFTLMEGLCLPQVPPSRPMPTSSPILWSFEPDMNQRPMEKKTLPLASSAPATTTPLTVSSSLLLRAWLTWFRTQILLLTGFILLFLLSGRSVSRL